MILREDWKKHLRYAWSIRLNLLAAFLSACEFLLPYVYDWTEIPRGLFTALSIIVIILSNVAKVMSQKEFRDE